MLLRYDRYALHTDIIQTCAQSVYTKDQSIGADYYADEVKWGVSNRDWKKYRV